MASILLFESRARSLIVSHLTKDRYGPPSSQCTSRRKLISMRVANQLATTAVCGLTICVLSYSLPSFGADVTASPTPDDKEVKKIVEPPKPPEPRFKIYGWIEAGITGNPDSPTDNHNFGPLFTDRANEPLLNQAVITAERALDPNATGFDWGFKLQFMYGSDARYIHSLGMMDLTTNERVQPDFPEVYATAHLPIITAGGVRSYICN